jgi:flagellar basal body-associated protein FliL
MNAALRSPLGKTALDATVFTIGSSPDNQLVIDDDMKVSAHHAEIRQESQGYSITDLGSTHGTYVNSQRLDWNTAYPLTQGSTIAIGDTTFTYEEGDAVPASPVPGTAEVPAGESEAGENADYTYPQTYAYGQTLPAYPAPGAAEPSTEYGPPSRRSRRRWLWIALAVLIVLVLAGGGTAVYFFTRATPEKAIDAYCNALRGQDYNSAYGMLSTTLHRSSTETEFAAKQQAIGRTTICTHDSANVTGNIATANLTLVAGGQSFAGVISLVSENGTWKISVPISSPELTLTIFCNALRAGDTHTAYNEYSKGLKDANPEAQFSQTFGGVTCAFSAVTVSGSSSTANIVFVNSSGPSSPYIILLIQDPANNSDWRIDGIQPA